MKFYKEVYQQKLRLKSEIRELKKHQKSGIPRYDLNTSAMLSDVIIYNNFKFEMYKLTNI